MLRKSTYLLICFLGCCVLPVLAQQPTGTTTTTSDQAVVPPVVNFGGILTDQNNKPLSGTLGVTFSLYKDEQGGSPLWLETQNVQADKTGHYSVVLGSTTSHGIPSALFTA